MEGSRFRKDAHRWERVSEVMRAMTDAKRITETPNRSWAQVSETVIGEMKKFQTRRMKAAAPNPPMGLE